MNDSFTIQDKGVSDAIDATLSVWDGEKISERIWAKDHTVWLPDPSELSNRLGWLDLPAESLDLVDELKAFAEEVRNADYRHVVLLGMGGSSLAPEVFARTFGSAQGHPELIVLDSTHPEAVNRVEDTVELSRTLILVASKSGTTLETLSFFRTFWDRISQISEKPGDQFVAITDPGSSLDETAAERGFRRVFHAPPTVGGRYSALSVFGLVPAALIGVDIRKLLERAGEMAKASSASARASENPSIRLGVAIAEFARKGVDKVTFFGSPALSAFPIWIEQLVAESVGKDDKGVVPIDGEEPIQPDAYSKDRLFVAMSLEGDGDAEVAKRTEALNTAGHPVVGLQLRDKYDVGAEMFRWELATAAAGAVLGIHPFNQPDVQLAKSLAKEAMVKRDTESDDSRDEPVSVEHAEELAGALVDWADVRSGDYVAVHAYVCPSPENAEKVQQIRTALGQKLGTASTVGFGPRFLHSTGQLHKGGANNGLFLQVVDDPAADLAVPETDFTFSQLISAQAKGDSAALRQRGRRTLRVNVGSAPVSGLDALLEAIG